MAELVPIDGYDDGSNGPSSRGAKYLKFDGATQTLWFLRESGQPAPRGPYYAPDIWEEHIKWTADKTVADRIRKVPGEPFPDVEDLNDNTPENEWVLDFNDKMVGPWRHTYNVGLVDPDTGARFIASNATTGIAIAYDGLREAVQFRRRIRGERVVPLVELSSAPMKTKRWGVKTIPHFTVKDWQVFGGSAPVAIAAAAEPMKPITTAEIVNDEIPGEPKVDPLIGKVKPAKRQGDDSNPDDGFPTGGPWS
jgi:hypothetical protein